MSWTPEVELEWGGERRKFALPLKQLGALEEKYDTSAFHIHDLIISYRAKHTMLADVIRLGLEGAGELKSHEIHSLMERWGPGARPLIEHMVPAQKILLAAIYDRDAKPGEGGAALDEPSD